MLHYSCGPGNSSSSEFIRALSCRYTRVVFLSPHLDDVVLSCGATVAGLVECGVDSRILTIFAGLPDPENHFDLARAFHEMCALEDDAVATRQEEDRAAAAILGASPVHVNLLDCLYRAHPLGGPRVTKFEQIRRADRWRS
jgi:LmbE family N-acetylglucosaminyl deacetylase